jgi:hypothetical protein
MHIGCKRVVVSHFSVMLHCPFYSANKMMMTEMLTLVPSPARYKRSKGCLYSTVSVVIADTKKIHKPLFFLRKNQFQHFLSSRSFGLRYNLSEHLLLIMFETRLFINNEVNRSPSSIQRTSAEVNSSSTQNLEKHSHLSTHLTVLVSKLRYK